MIDEDASTPRVGIDWRISLTLIFAVFVSSLGLISWALTSANHAADALQQLADLRIQVATGTQPVPSLSIHVDNIEKWLNHADAAGEIRDKRLNDLERNLALQAAELAGIVQASSVRLPRR